MQGHTEEITDPARRNKTVLLIKPDCALQRNRCIEIDSCATADKEILFSYKKQLFCDSLALPRRIHCHAPQVTFFTCEAGCNCADDLTIGAARDVYPHIDQPLPNRFRARNRVPESAGGVLRPKGFKGRLQTGADTLNFFQLCSARRDQKLVHHQHDFG